MSEQRFVYFADPMCSWCYGFSPVIAELAERFEGRLGLQRGDGRPARRQHGAHARRGQGLYPRRLDPRRRRQRPALRLLVPRPRGLRLRHRARLPRGGDGTAAAAAAGAALHEPHCPSLLRREPRHDLGRGDCSRRRGGGLRPARSSATPSSPPTPATRPSAISSPPRSSASAAFPTLIAGSEEKGYALVTNGYRPLDDVLDPLERWWAAGAPVTKAG